MYYAIYAKDHPDSLQARRGARDAHLQRLRALCDDARLLVAGPLPLIDGEQDEGGFGGSLIIAEFESLQAARDWANADPYFAAGVYASVEVLPFKKVLP